MEQKFGWWLVAYTEFCRHFCVFLIFEDDDNVRILAVSRYLICQAQELNLEPMLRSMENVKELTHILNVIDGTRFDTLPKRWCHPGEDPFCSVGRSGCAVDYMYYNIHSNRDLSDNWAYRLIHIDWNIIPEGHSRG